EDDPMAAENWLDRTMRVLKQLNCTPEQNLVGAVSLLQDDAYQWWDTVTSEVQPERIIWEFFLTEFRKKYISKVYLEERRREFISLRQIQLSVAEYEREFVRLMERVRINEQNRRERQQKRGPGRSSAFSTLSKKSKGPPAQSSGPPQGQGQSEGPRPQFTPRRGQSTPSMGSSLGTVFRGLAPASSACQYCQKPASESAERPDTRIPARAYAIRAQEEQDAPDVIRGTFSLYNTSVNALVDPGSTHSYICIKLPTERGVPVEESDQDILVTNPLGHSVVVNKVYKGCPLRIQGYEFLADLIELPFHEFDVIL
ncbi:hypothetical protein P3X46_013911, partial [Hevea brasiliensis]